MWMKGLDEGQEDIVDKWAPRAGARVYFNQDEVFWINLQNPHPAPAAGLGIGSRRHVTIVEKRVRSLWIGGQVHYPVRKRFCLVAL